MKPKYCPKCKEDEVRKILTKGRKNIFECENCYWKSKPFIPKTRPIKHIKNVSPNNFYGYCYEVFDKYGQPCVFSRSYDTREDAIKEMMDDISKGIDKPYGPYTGVLWPKTVEVKGEVFK